VIAELPLIFESVRRACWTGWRPSTEGQPTPDQPDAHRDAHALRNRRVRPPPALQHHHRGFRPGRRRPDRGRICESVQRAHADLARPTWCSPRASCHDASANPLPSGVRAQPPADRAHFRAVDPWSPSWRMERPGSRSARLTWSRAHTSMPTRNRLISSDNKGYAAYHWERTPMDRLPVPEAARLGGRVRPDERRRPSPNLNLRPGSGADGGRGREHPADRLAPAPAAEALARRAGRDAVRAGTPLTPCGCPSHRAPEFTGDGRAHRTRRAGGGAAALPAVRRTARRFPVSRGPQTILDTLSARVLYRLSARLRESQAPKGVVLDTRRLNRLRPVVGEHPAAVAADGSLYLVGVPAEVGRAGAAAAHAWPQPCRSPAGPVLVAGLQQPSYLALPDHPGGVRTASSTGWQHLAFAAGELPA